LENLFFHKEEVSFRISESTRIKSWLNLIAKKGKVKIVALNYIFCSDEYLYAMNKEYLNHDTYTDIITFDQSEVKGMIEGDIFISIDRVKENAQALGIPFPLELKRVMAHGLLHLMGFKDKTKADQTAMRKKEDECLSLYK